MSLTRNAAFDLFVNWMVWAGFFALLAAGFVRLIGKTRAKYQHIAYLMVLLLAVVAPAVNTFWLRLEPAAKLSTTQAQAERTRAASQLWPWASRSPEHASRAVPLLRDGVLAVWALATLWQAARITAALRRAQRLRKEAEPLQMSVGAELVREMNLVGPHIALLTSEQVQVPVTFGVFKAAVVVPAALAPKLDERDLRALLAHECAHIRRNDFLIHSLCEVLTVPVFWHPGIRFLMSKVSQTRELACDDDAATHVGKRLTYARSLLRLASMCLHMERTEAQVGVSVFDGDNLEDRIMKLTQKKRSLTRAGMSGLALLLCTTFGSGLALARAMSVQTTPAHAVSARDYAGTWHWMFHGKSFSTMTLIPSGSGYSGTVTESKIALDDQGNLSKADPSPDGAVSSITKTVMEESGLRVTVGDGDQPFAFVVHLEDATHAKIQPVGAPENMKPIDAEKAR